MIILTSHVKNNPMYSTPHAPSKHKDDDQSTTSNFSSSNEAKSVSYRVALLLHDIHIHHSVVLTDNINFPSS